MKAPCMICGTETDHERQPTYEDRKTGQRIAITPTPVWACDGCTYEAANFKGRYVDERQTQAEQQGGPEMRKTIRVQGVWTMADTLIPERRVPFTVLCEVGKEPRIVLAWPEDGLSVEQWDTLQRAVNRAWGAVAIRCRCGHAYFDHSHRSPHACSAGCKDCRSFAAAEPVIAQPKPETAGDQAP